VCTVKATVTQLEQNNAVDEESVAVISVCVHTREAEHNPSLEHNTHIHTVKPTIVHTPDIILYMIH